MKALLVVGAIIILIGGYVLTVHNRLVTANEGVDSQWAQVESQYQRRFDLIPGLVESAKVVMNQEQEISTAIAEARTRYSGAASVDEKVTAASNLDNALARLLVIVENYPQLKSSDTVGKFMDQLEGTENRISVERMRYNESVNVFNVQIRKIPAKWVASASGFSARSYFESVGGSESPVKVEF